MSAVTRVGWSIPLLMQLLPAAVVSGGSATAPAIAPATTRVTQTTQSARDESAEAVDFLCTSVYGKLLVSADWMERSLALISIARLPGSQPTDLILEAMQADKTPAVRVVAWQCLLSRAKVLSSTQYKKWREATSALVKLDAFRGQTRIGLIRMLAVEPPTKRTKRLWAGIFEHTNATQQQDIPVLDALGDCLGTWRSPDIMQYLFEHLAVLEDAYRAEYVLHRAGVDAPWAGEHCDVGHYQMWKIATENYAAWWRTHRNEWKELAHPDADNPWRTLEPQFVPAADLSVRVDRYDSHWKKELELGTPDVRGMDVVFIVDTTGSMQWLIEYLKQDIERILCATALVSTNPRIGITFYRDHGDMFVTRSIRLTSKLPELRAAISTMDAAGGEDEPEAVYEALVDALGSNNWRWDKNVRRAAVLVTDAAPHAPTQADCEQVADECRKNAVRLYVVKASRAALPELDAIATAAGGQAVAIQDLQPWQWPYRLPPLRGNARYTLLASAPSDRPIDRQILSGLLGDAISPAFRDRVEPLVAIMLSLTTDYVPEHREIFGVASPHAPGPPGPGPQAR